MAILACMFIGCGCRTKDPQTLPRGWDILERAPIEAQAVSRKVLLLADNQIRHLYGDPFLQSNILIDTHLSSVTIRPPQLDLFGQDLFRWVLRNTQDMPVIHLGDALDLSCTAEYDEFEQIMADSGRTWVMAPGNHDGYFFGNFDNMESSWNRACQRGGGPMAKDAFIARYLEALARQWPSLRQHLSASPTSGEWSCDSKVEDNCFLQSLRWRIDPVARWRSYVLQKIDLSHPSSNVPFSAILIDSAQYSKPPRPLLLHAGEEGSFQSDQAEALQHWLDSAAARDERVVLVMHHPYENLAQTSRDHLSRLMHARPVQLLVTAHTHDGYYSTHISQDRVWLELNVGSILDWPIEYRTLQFRRLQHESHGNEAAVVLASELIRLPDQWLDDLDDEVPVCDPRWEANPGDLDYYLDYRALSTPDARITQRKIYDNLLAAYQRMSQVMAAPGEPAPPAGNHEDASDLARRIGEALRSTSLIEKRDALLWLRTAALRGDSRTHQHYRLCQAKWASQYERRRARVPGVHDEYILMPSASKQ